MDWTTETIGDNGAAAVFVLMALESACIPIPSEVIQLFAGFVVSEGKMSFVVAVLAGSVGNLVGSWVAYYVGAKGGRPLLERHGKWFHISTKHLDLADHWFERYGNKVVFWSRMLPIVRTFISLPAGVARMPIWQFSVYTFLGAVPWCLMLTFVGYQVGENWEDVEKKLKYFDYSVAAILVGGAVYLYVRWRRNRTTTEV